MTLSRSENFEESAPADLLVGGIATGIGSWPGTDPREAAATIIGELPDLAHLVELPQRGIGADMIGRVSALLVDLRFDSTTRGYRLAARPGAVSRRARDLLQFDLDAIEEAWETTGLVGTGRVVKLQSAGPLTLAAEVELPGGHRILTDTGAVRDLSESLAEGLARHADEVRRRLGAEVVIQLDEPQLTTVLDGSLRGPSILNTISALPEPEALRILDTVIDAQSAPVLLHTCASRPALATIGRTAAAGISFDASTITTADLDVLGDIVDRGKKIALGLVPTEQPAAPTTWRAIAEPAVRLIDRLGFPRTTLATQVLATPGCGLAGAPLDWARKALSLSTDVARAFTEDPESINSE
ncbi:methionine synthase [Nocardia ignorata]|uniref:Methionine synthase II (Cobalamin-independent) n=1 Tax=Nocardia ignorata TaxID=145285 RepID=A0A4R6PSR7_NOCIG|nr:methionine synthase [Nocardia ignorata]TDP41881.1 methionine synthase II (cobalamin-independent) [Nocardia ignorata]